MRKLLVIGSLLGALYGCASSNNPECEKDNDCQTDQICENYQCMPRSSEGNCFEDNNCIGPAGPKGDTGEMGLMGPAGTCSCAVTLEYVQALEARIAALERPQCTPNANLACLEDDVYSYDSCGNLEELFEECNYGCSNGQCLQEYEDNRDGTVSDNNTGFLWQKGTGGRKVWDAAVSYCDNLDLAGHNDWRLPNIDELRMLIVGCPATEAGGSCEVTDGCDTNCPGAEGICREGCAIGEGPFDGCYMPLLLEDNCFAYWSSSVDASDISRAWRLHFDRTSMYPDHMYGDYYVRCVR